jgi:hypothetical protein
MRHVRGLPQLVKERARGGATGECLLRLSLVPCPTLRSRGPPQQVERAVAFPQSASGGRFRATALSFPSMNSHTFGGWSSER